MFVASPDLSALAGIRHAFFTREGGVSTGIYATLNGGLGSRDERASVLENRARMAAVMQVPPERFLSTYQIHSPTVVAVDGPWTEDRPEADGMVTATPGLALAVNSADCGPILFADPGARVVGAAHAGWKGAFSGVVAATLQAMEALGARRAEVTAVLGPTISQAAYEVGPEFVARFEAHNAGLLRFFRPSDKPGHAMFDLPGFISHQAAAAGVGRFVDLGLCTYADERRFFSFRRTTHRAELDYGRQLSAIALA